MLLGMISFSSSVCDTGFNVINVMHSTESHSEHLCAVVMGGYKPRVLTAVDGWDAFDEVFRKSLIQ